MRFENKAEEGRSVTQTREALVIGGGPAGAAVATLLARGGREVTLVEKTTGAHDKVCGEFLSGEAMQYLTQLGIDLRVLGSVPVYGARIARKKIIAECELPFAAASVTRRNLDEALLGLASQAGVELSRGIRVDALNRSGQHWDVRLASGDRLQAQQVFLATGKHDVAGWRRSPGSQNDLVAFKMYLALATQQQVALRGWVELCLFPGGYAGLQSTENQSANLCLLVNRKTLNAIGGDWNALLTHILNSSGHLAERLDGAEALLEKPLALSSIPYGMLLQRADPALWRLGDQAAVTPSFSGDGMSIALHSAKVAAGLYLNGRSSAEFATRMHQELRRSLTIATSVSRLMITAPALAPLMKLHPTLMRVLAENTRVPRAALVS